VSEISTRIWLDERLWEDLRSQAETEGITVRELIPLLVRQVAGKGVAPEAAVSRESASAPARPLTPEPPPLPTAGGPPIVTLTAEYQCGVCGVQIRMGGLSNHLGRHLKEQQSAEAERS
jgi:hypothetical protein